MKHCNWIFDKPQAIIDRSFEYCMSSTPENTIFLEFFERINPATVYADDEDITFPAVWKIFKQKIDTTYDKAEKKAMKKITKDTLKLFFTTNRKYKNDFILNENRHTWVFKGYRRKPSELDDDDQLDEE
jgi:hypothetical protein